MLSIGFAIILRTTTKQNGLQLNRLNDLLSKTIFVSKATPLLVIIFMFFGFRLTFSTFVQTFEKRVIFVNKRHDFNLKTDFSAISGVPVHPNPLLAYHL